MRAKYKFHAYINSVSSYGFLIGIIHEERSGIREKGIRLSFGKLWLAYSRDASV